MLFRKSRKKDKSGTKAAERGPRAGPTIIASDMVVDGMLVTAGDVQIDGTLNGHIRARGVIVGVQAVVHGEVAAEEVFIRGRVIGPVRGLSITVVSGGHVEGDVTNQNVAIENGAYIDGKIQHSDNPLSDYPEGYGAEQPDYSQNIPEVVVSDDSGYRSVELVAPQRAEAAE